MKTPTCLLFLASPLFFSSCLVTYGDNIARTYSVIHPGAMPAAMPAKGIPLYYEGENTNFSYTKMGWITVEGSQGKSQDELQDHLKYEAYKNGANAVLLVKSSYKVRERGMLFSKTPPEKYDALVLSGLAVTLDSLPYTKFIDPNADTSFVNKARRSDFKDAKRGTGQFIGSVILTITCIAIAAYYAISG